MTETLAMLVHQLGCLDMKRDVSVWMVALQKLCDLFEARLLSPFMKKAKMSGSTHFKKLQASTDKNFIARLFRNNFVTMASIGWTHPDLALEVFKCFVSRRQELRDLSLLKGGLPVVKTIEEH